ncbi:DUF7662 domain-containing protein [Heliomicrobium gestii]
MDVEVFFLAGKYQPLQQYLQRVTEESILFTYSDIESIINDKLPPSAFKYPAWWANEISDKKRHTQSHSWMNAGYVVEQISLGSHVVFRKQKLP